MKISLKWLQELVEIDSDHDILRQNFNLKSAEVAGITKLADAKGVVVGHVTACVKHKDADKLSVCQVDVGNEELQIVCGAANVAKDQKVVVALDGAMLAKGLKIKKTAIRGVESNGMICSLDELGIEHKYHQEGGIHVLPPEAVVGEDALNYMHLDDFVLELDLTPNRADLLSMVGVAHDIMAMTGKPVKYPDIEAKTGANKNPVSVFTDTKGCMSYYGQVIKNIKVAKSPYWLQSRLIASGIRPINNVVDITNYVMLELGNPLHAFDYDKLGSNQIIVREAKDKEKITTLDGKVRILEQDDMLITNGDKPIAIAGVMGGADTEVDENTTTVFLEAATFDPIRVRRTSKKLDLRSESSLRFERGLDPKRTVMASKRAMKLLQELCGGEIMNGINHFDVNDNKDVIIQLTLEKLEQVTGFQYAPAEIEEVIKRLGFGINRHDSLYQVSVPSRRQDVRNDQDLIEEIVRLTGYHKIPLTYPQTPTSGFLTETKKRIRKLRDWFIAFGFNETITYSLVSEASAEMFDISPREVISILNPLSEEKACLRHSLLPSLIGVANYNRARNLEDISLFEIGKGYFVDRETLYVSGLIFGKYRPSIWQKDISNVDFYMVKGILSALIAASGLDEPIFDLPNSTLANLHPGIAARIVVKGQEIGFIGRLHPELEHREELPDTYVFEIDLDKLLNIPTAATMMKPVSKFPAITRDLALVVNTEVPVASIVQAIQASNVASLRQVEVFDVFRGGSLLDNQQSVAFSLLFQHDDKTLSTEDVDEFMKKIIRKVNDFGATLR